MAVPSSGTLSLLGLAREKVHDDYTSGAISGQIPLKFVTIGGQGGSQQETYDATNTDSASYPDGSAPYNMIGWYSYDHDFVALSTAYRTASSYAKPLAACNQTTDTQIWFSGSFSNGDTVYTNSAGSATLAAGNYGYGSSGGNASSRFTTNSSGVVTTGPTVC